MNLKHLIIGFFAVFCLSNSLSAQKPRTISGQEINLPQPEQTYHFDGNKRINDRTGFPLAIYNLNYQVTPGTPQNMALQYLNAEGNTFGIDQNTIANLRVHNVRTSLSGTTVRFRQYINDIPVNKAEITLSINNDNAITYVMNALEYDINIKNTTPSVQSSSAKQIAFNYLNINETITYENVELFISNSHSNSRLAYRINVTAHDLIGEWEVFVDAKTGEIFKAQDVSYYCSEEEEPSSTSNTPSTNSTASALAVGTGNVFNPDPLSSAGVAYGTGGYTDNNDANSTALTSQTMSVTLNDITLTGSTYSLVGPYAEITDHESPFNGLFTQNSSDFSFQRLDSGFEAVSVYYHIDASMRYINNTLGIVLLPYQYTTGVRVDPHGFGGADNSSYSSGTGRLQFGEGGVDDAEDSDVVHHELGHGLHDWVTSGGLSQVNGLSEGCGDYWAQSYNRSLGNWSSTDPAYNYVFNWDGHNEYWNGRTTGYGATYPGGLVGQIHTDGQIWATCLMKIYDIIGKAQTDTIFFEGLGMTNGSSSQNDAANAAYQAAINMGYSTAEILTIYTEFTGCGYTLPAPPAQPIAEFSADNTILCIDSGPVTVNFADETTGVPTSWSWSFPGGTPSTSSAQNPSVVYTAAGTYQVALTVSNSFGSDTETKVAYINVATGDACPSCVTTASTDIPVAITSSGTPTITSTLTVSGSGIINDINVASLIGTHSWINDLEVRLSSPAGTEIVLFSDICFNEDNFDVVFDDSAASGTLPCPPTGGLTYQPSGSLAAFNGEDANGTWTLTISDSANQDGGELTAWSLEICHDPALSIIENELNSFSVYPNPNNGSFNVKFNGQGLEDVTIAIFDIRGRSILNNTYTNTSNFNETVNINGAQSGIYMMKISSGNQSITKKLIVN